MGINFTAEQFDQILQTTLPFYLRDKMFSQADQATPALTKFKSAKKTYPGGQEIILNPRFGRENSMELVTSSDQQLTFNTVNPLKQAKYTWDMSHYGLTFTWQEMLTAGFSLKNGDAGDFPAVSGQDKIRIQNLLTSKFEQMDFDMRHGWSQDRVWSDGSNGFPGVRALVTKTPTTGTTGTLSRVSLPLWRNRALVSADAIAWSVANSTLIHTMNSEMVQLRRYGTPNHMAYCGSLFLEALRLEAFAKGQLTQTGFSKGDTDVNITGIKLGNIMFQYEPALDDVGEEEYCYIIDHNAINLYMHAGNDMTVHEPKRPHDVLAYYKSILWSGAMVANQLNTCGVYQVLTSGLPSA